VAEPAPSSGTPIYTAHTGRTVTGDDLSRIISLSDGVFAFALTLLVLSLILPSGLSNGQLGAQLHKDYPAFLGYVFAFFLIGNWWVVHHRMFGYIRRYDGRLIGINMAILMEIAVMPFVLSVFADYSGDLYAVLLFASTQAVTGLTFVTLWVHATYRRQLVAPDLSASLVRYTARRGLLTPLIFGVSIAVAFVSVTGAELVWLGAIVVPRLTERYGA
jgi:uncharacterized membrane protein